MFSKTKKTPLQVISLSKTVSRANICLSHGDSHHSTTKDYSKILRKESSSKNLKLGISSSGEFPQILTKSASQTTMNRKMDETKLKLL
jgi:alpha-acetolactate decarboxylase